MIVDYNCYTTITLQYRKFVNYFKLFGAIMCVKYNHDVFERSLTVKYVLYNSYVTFMLFFYQCHNIILITVNFFYYSVITYLAVTAVHSFLKF